MIDIAALPPLGRLKLGDVEVFARVLRAGSINGAARSLRLGPSQASKAVRRLERYLGARLFARSARGLELTEHGRALAPRLVELLTRAAELSSSGSRADPELTMAAPSFVWSAGAARIAARVGGARLLAVETASPTMTAYAGAPLFDVAVTFGETAWPASWHRTRLGVLRRGLFATPAHARRLGRRVRAEALRGQRFIGRLAHERDQLLPSHDGCPLADRERTIVHRAQTVATALELGRATDALVFAPALAARALVQARALAEVRVLGWNVEEPAWLVCHVDRVPASVERALAAELPLLIR
jgi:DNA-binding transcriptional LysR family regulator